MKKFKDFKILLVYPNLPMAQVLLPAGVSIISAVLKQAGFQCKLFDTTLYPPKGESFDEYRKKIKEPEMALLNYFFFNENSSIKKNEIIARSIFEVVQTSVKDDQSQLNYNFLLFYLRFLHFNSQQKN